MIGDDVSAENLSELWANTEDQMQRRTLELEEIIADTQKLKDHERDLDRWLTKAEAELDLLTSSKGSGGGQAFDSPRRLPLSPDTSRKRLQDLGDSLALGREKLRNYTHEAESLMTRFQSEDTSKIRKDLEQITDRWDQFNKRLKQTVSSGIERICEDFMLESEKTFGPKGQQTSSFEPRLISASSREKLTEKLDHIDRKVNRIAQMEIDLKRQHGMVDESVNVTEQRSQLINELQALQTEINNLSAQITGGTMLSHEDMNLLPDSEFLTRWRQLRDKVASLRQTVQTSSGQAHLFLARLKEMNNWVAHRDAAFRATICPLSGNLLFILKLRETMLNLFKEIEAHRPQIEDVLQQGLVQYGDERSETGLGCDSELESDASDMAVHGSSQRQDSRDSTGDDQSKQRVIRRIRRYLYHLRKRWLALNSSMLEYKQKLDAVSDRLSNFQSMFNDVVEQVRSAHAVALRWMPVDCLPVDRIGTELEQAKSFYEACDPLVILLNNLDRQIVQFHDSQIALDPHIITQQAALRNDFDQVRFLTEARIRALSQTLVSIQAIDQRTQPQLTRSPSHRTPIEGGRYTGMDPTENFVNGKMESPVPMQAESVPLSDSVSPPWERCVHPSGTQVPYYKNHASQDTQWDHPILSDLMQSMKQMNAFRFAEYRTALKLRKLQKTLCLDSLSISILAENLKHIGHSQPIDEHNQDPFDRTINVPQMIDCLLDLFSCANGMFGLSDSQGTPVKQQAGGDWAASQQKTGASAKYSTLPSTRSSDTDALHQSRVTPTKCGKGFRRHSSTIRDQQRTSRDPASARPLISSPVPGGVQPTSPLTPGTRCASLPESVTFTATASPVHRTGSDRTRRSTRKGKRHFLVGPTRLPVHVCVDLTLNWLLNVYDRMRKGNVRALSFKVALTTLSVANLDEKYRYLFSLIADPNGCVTEQRLYALLCECILIPRNLGEGGWIGKEDFASTVKHCFEQVAEIARSSESGPHFSPRNIPVRHFLTWLRFGPKTIIWLPLLHRIMLAEQVVHNVRCGVCQRQPLTGLRYRCLRCLNFDLCQQCFFCGWTARSHKLSHPMQEYCTNSTSGDSFRDFTRIVRNRLRSRDRGGQRADSEQTSITTRYSRGRSTCCDANSFGEDKPRPAPTFGPDLVSLLPRDSALLDSSPFKRNDWSKGGDSIGTPDDQIVCSQAQAPVASEPPVSRPSSSQVPYSPEYRLPPRAASDTRQFQRGTLNDGTGVTGRSTFPKSHFSRLQHTNAIDIDDEHNLIAQYSNELRQQSEPELNPVQQMVSSTHSAVPTIMDRSTISDGIPCTPVTALGNEALPAHAGHSSLDRRQLGRLTGGQTYLSYSGPQNGSLDVQPSYYPGAPYPYPLSSNPALPRMISHESHLIPNIQRSYSLRARSQPPPDVHGFRHNFGPNFDPRSPWPPALQPANYHGNSDQTVRTLEDERKLLQMEYDRLRQRTNTPTYLPSSSSSRLQTQQAQQRFARMQLQHQLMHQQQQQDPMRASLARPYLPRIPLHRPPSVGSAFPNGSLNTGQPTITGRVSYGGSLGRSKNTSNGFGYLIDSYGSEPRVGGYPYGFEAGGMDPMSTNQTAVSSELAIEARRLREHRGRLEVRMQQLEDQNKQLEHKLQRLRQYLISGGTASGAGGASGTNKIPTELLLDRINANSKTSLRQRSASGGLASQAHPVDGKAYRGSGSVGQLMGPASLEIKQAGTKTPVNSIDRSQQEEQNKITSTPQDYYQVPVDDSFPVITSPGPRTDDIHATFRPTLLRSDSNQY
ncbi:Dystrophin, isoforms A/C/F/G/H [Clonorchis sinensis]|uniref:Dystrophin, isoforms A/C/F/G/H n=1 Tax=Clonorchis sinensis TaxID=79923 RepID=A0A8T1M589_CLOSI|nr:Dystrophin, isoforms A/C/F/G/H [Clonorchis sinensis]